MFVAATETPDRGRIAPHLCGDLLHPLALSDREHNPRVLDLEEGQRSTPGDLLKDRLITRSERERKRLAATHGRFPAESRSRIVMIAASRISCRTS
jgi:hypothetical protein